MKIKMIKGPRPGQRDMVCSTAHGTFAIELDQVIDIEDKQALAAMNQWPGCFHQVSDAPAKKVEKAPEVLEAKAEVEAAKVMQSYQVKKA
jgi:hypothetical protein